MVTTTELVDDDDYGVTGTEVVTETLIVDARVATAWLQRVIERPRKVREPWVDQLARDILAGRWRVGASTIKWTGPTPSAPGSVIGDGQHRLWAVQRAQEIADARYERESARWDSIVTSGLDTDGLSEPKRQIVAVPMEVSWNVPRESIDVVDTNKPRLFSDVMFMTDPNTLTPRSLSAVVRWALQWESGNPMAYSILAPTFGEMNEFWKAHSAVLEAGLLRGRDLGRAHIAPITLSAVAYQRFARIDQERAHRFFDGLISGSNLDPKSPILALRNRLIARWNVGGRGDRSKKLALCVYAWNAYQEGRDLERVTMPRIKLTNESFPEPHV